MSLKDETRARIAHSFNSGADRGGSRWLKRIELEIEFARALADALPDTQTAGWHDLIESAEAVVDAYDAATGLDGLVAAVTSAENLLAPIGTVARQYTALCVGHGHIDMNWM